MQRPPSYQDDFARLLRPHFEDALRFCISLSCVDRSHEPEDLLQDALIKAFNNFKRLKDQKCFKAWLFQIIIRTHRSLYRTSFWRRFTPLSDSTESIPGIDIADSKYVIHQQLQRQLAILDKREREAIILFEVSGFSIEEIRRIQGDRSISAVKSRLSRARSRLKDQTAQQRGMHQTIQSSAESSDDFESEVLSTTTNAVRKLNGA